MILIVIIIMDLNILDNMLANDCSTSINSPLIRDSMHFVKNKGHSKLNMQLSKSGLNLKFLSRHSIGIDSSVR